MEEEQVQDSPAPPLGAGQASGELEAIVESLTAELESERMGHQGTREQLGTAVMRYREALVAGNPGIPAELISGDSIEELDAAVEGAQRIVGAVLRQAQETAPAKLPVPAGAPVRTGPDVSAMNAVEKIKFGLTGGGN